MRTSVALYPYCAELLPAVRHFDELQNKFKLTKLFAPEGLGLIGKDASYACNHPNIGMVVSALDDFSDPSWQILLLVKTHTLSLPDDDLERVMEQALRYGKKVLYYNFCREDIPESIFRLADNFPDRVQLFAGDINIPDPRKAERIFSAVKIPVVLVGGLVQQADVGEVLYGLAACLRADGYRPLVISEQPIGPIFDFYSIAHIMRRKDLSEAEKILEINLLLRDLTFYESPQIILMEAPDAVMRFNERTPNGYGILTYLLCQAAEPDYFVCCVPKEYAAGDFLEAISGDLSCRLGAPVSCVHVSNLVLDFTYMLQWHRISYAHSEINLVRDQITRESANSTIPMFDVVGGSANGMYAFLQENVN